MRSFVMRECLKVTLTKKRVACLRNESANRYPRHCAVIHMLSDRQMLKNTGI